MKKKLLVLTIALILACSMVGTSLALYVRTDSKNVSIQTGEAITLSFGSTALESFTISPSSLSTTYEVTLTNTGSGSVSGMAGFFRAIITDSVGGNLSSVLTVSGIQEHEGDEDVALTSDDILKGKSYSLSNLPYVLNITIALNTAVENFDFMDYAEESVTIVLYWVPYDYSAYYLRLSSDNWLPNSNNVMVQHDEDEYKIEGITLAANTELKFSHNGISGSDGWFGWADPSEGNAVSTSGDNLIVTAAGVYDFYIVVTGGQTGKVWAVKVSD